MAEFCKKCFLEMYEINLKKQKIIVSKDFDLCESCGEEKPVVIKLIDKNPIRRIRKKIRGY